MSVVFSADMVHIRKALVEDVDSIVRLYEKELLRPANAVVIETSIKHYPVFIAEKDGVCVGFVYCRKFSPDILEPVNILVAEDYQSQGIGTRLLAAVEDAAVGVYAALLLVNTTLYKENKKKRDASAFYLKAGYSVIFKTEGSTVFSKTLPSV